MKGRGRDGGGCFGDWFTVCVWARWGGFMGPRQLFFCNLCYRVAFWCVFGIKFGHIRRNHEINATFSENFCFYGCLCRKSMQLFLYFSRNTVAYGGRGQWLGSSACRGFYLDCCNSLREACEKWVQTRGYLTMRILHADTPTRLFSGSAHFSQTSLKKLREPQINTKLHLE